MTAVNSPSAPAEQLAPIEPYPLPGALADGHAKTPADMAPDVNRSRSMKPLAVLPVLMRDAEVISLKEASFRTGLSEKTIRRWCRQDGIGRRAEPSAPWEISALALEAKRIGVAEAIEDLRRGEFVSDKLRRYLTMLGLESGS